MPLRALQGFIDSIFRLAHIPLSCPHYTCISRRDKQVEVSFKTKKRGAIQHLAIDSTGLKVYGEGEWKVKKHGTDGKRRVLRKLHIAVDTSTHELIAAELSLSTVTDGEALPNLLKQTRRSIFEVSGDGAYDTRACHAAIKIKGAIALVRPREGAAFWERGHPRNLAVGCQKLYGSNKYWKERYGYHRRSLSETAMYRVKHLLGERCETWEYRPKNTNPCRGFKRYKEGGGERYLSKDELRQLWRVLDTLEGDNPAKVMIIRLLIYTGCRSSEVRTLQWKEYRGGHWHLLDSKTGAKTVYLCSQVRAYLDAWQSESPYLFPAPCNTQPISTNQLGIFWRQARQLAGLEGVRLHDLRHTYASIAIQSKVNLIVLSRLLGHAEAETTLKYAHLGRDDVCQAASHVSGVLVKGMRS